MQIHLLLDIHHLMQHLNTDTLEDSYLHFLNSEWNDDMNW